MEEETKQAAVTDTESEAQPSPEVPETSNAQSESDDFEKALSEFDSTDSMSSPSQDEQSEEDTSALARRLRELENQIANNAYQSDIGTAISQIRGEIDADAISNEYMEIWLNAEAKKDPRIATAWANRSFEQAKYKRVLKGLADKFQKAHSKFSKYDSETTEAREAVAQAVKGSSNSAPEASPPDFSKMTDQELQKYTMEKYGF